MAEFINLQVFGVPVLTYGLVGVTTAVLAYATSIGMEDTISKTVGSLTEMTANPLGSLSDVSPLSDKEPNTSPVEEPKPNPENPPALTGGKKRRRKTPKAKRRKNKSKRASK